MDVAKLGIEVSSKGTSQATAELTKLTNAAKMAEQAVEGLSSKQNASRAALAAAKGYQSQSAAALAAARASGTASQEDIKSAQAAYQKARAVTAAAKADLDAVSASLAAAKADQQQASAALKAAQAINQATAAANDNVTKVGVNAQRMGGSMSGLAAQFQDIGVTAAMGMNPMMIALQQGTQIAGQMEMAMQGGARASSVFAAAFASLLSPVTLVSIALTATAAAGLQMVNWTGLAASGLNAVADALQTIAPYAAAAAASLALIYAPAIVGGMISIIALLGRISVAALGAASSFTAAWLAALGPVGAVIAALAVVTSAAIIFRDELSQILGVDIGGAAKTGVNYIIGSFVAAFEDIKFVWNNLPNVVGAAAVGAANMAIRAINHMINGAKMAINDLISAINLIPGVDIAALDTSGGTIGEIENTFAAGLADGVAARNKAVAAALSHDYLGQIGGAIAAGASAASSKLKELAKDITAVDDKTKKKRGGGKTEAEKYPDIVDGANRRIASLKAEEAALGMTEEAALKLKYETELLNQAQQKGINLTAAQRAELSGLAGQMASTETATKKAKEAMDFAKDATMGFLSDLRSGLANGEGFWKSFGKAALNVLDKIIGKIEDQLVDALFSVSGSGGGGGGFLGSIFGGLFGGGKGAFPSAPGVGLYASGTASARAGMAIVGEEGPELVRFKGGEQVVPNHQLRAANSNGGAGGNVISVNFAPVINAPNADKAELAAIRQDLRRMKAELPSTILSTVKDGQKRRAI